MLRGSSMVERRAVNAMVVGSSPTRGAKVLCESDPSPVKDSSGKMRILDGDGTAQEPRPITRADGTPEL